METTGGNTDRARQRQFQTIEGLRVHRTNEERYIGRARHICRKCDMRIDPQPNAHQLMVKHFATHGLKMPATCKHECGFRATPSEGRYSE